MFKKIRAALALQKEQEDKLRKDRFDNLFDQRKEELGRERAAMYSSHCPFMGEGNCSNRCIHHFKGRVGSFDGTPYVVSPSCKLWR